MKCSFLLLTLHTAGCLSAIFVRDSWKRELDVLLHARSHGQLRRRTPPELGSPKPSKPFKPGLLTIPENTNQEGNARYSSPRPDRGRQADSARPTSPYSNQLSPSLQGFAKVGFPRPVSPSRERPKPGSPDPAKPSTRTSDSSKQDGAIRDSKATNRKTIATPPAIEAHSLVSGTGYAFSSSKHKYGGLLSQSSVESVLHPVMRSAKDHEWVKAGGVTTKADGKATAVATGSKVIGKLGRADQSEGTGFIEFRAGQTFQQIHKVGPGEKIERTLNAGDVLDSRNNRFKQATVTTHLTGEGNCLAGACNTAQDEVVDEDEAGKPKQA